MEGDPGDPDSKCKCVCPPCYKQVEAGCEPECICPKACDTSSDSSGVCNSALCDPCTPSNATDCPADTDCIIVGDSELGTCTDSGVCTAEKDSLCDEAYAVVTGKTDNSAKCCPATSGCIKSQIGVKATSTCSTNCGNCLEKKSVDGKEIPATFCMFGQRLSEYGSVSLSAQRASFYMYQVIDTHTLSNCCILKNLKHAEGLYECTGLAQELRENSCFKGSTQVDCSTNNGCNNICGSAGCIVGGSVAENICCDDASSSDNAILNVTGSFNCMDGDPNSTDSSGGKNAYYGNGTTIPDKDYMCIRDLDSVADGTWDDPTTSGINDGSDGSAPICPNTRRLMELRMEELFSSYKKHNSKVQLTQPQSYKSSETKAATEEVDAPKDDDIPSCRMGVPIADVRRLSADQCNPSATPEKLPLDIISRSGKTVTFTLSQVWKECNYGSSTNNKMDWIAADFVVPDNGELECFKTSGPDCGIVNAFTAKCTEGLALIDIYAVDETATGIFYQTDGSSLTIPDACAAGGNKGDTTKACKFRYVLNCMEACEDDKETSGWWTTDSLWRKLTDAFRRG